MAGAEYTHGEMDIADQSNTWSGFMKASTWGSFIVMLGVAYMTFTIAMHMNWMIALVLCAGAGIVGGLAIGMGGAWVATVVALSALAVFIQIIITVVGWFI